MIKQFVKKTGHNIQQFLGRNLLSIALPNELDEADLIAVAKIHFPEMDEDYLTLIAAKAMQSESYLMAVEAIAKRARYIARRDTHPTITFEDLELAISEVLPGSRVVTPKTSDSTATIQLPARRHGKNLQRVIKPSEAPLKPDFRGSETNRISLVNQSENRLEKPVLAG